MVIPTIAIDSSEAEKEKCLANLAAKENTLMKYADKIKFFRYLINNQMRDLNNNSMVNKQPSLAKGQHQTKGNFKKKKSSKVKS